MTEINIRGTRNAVKAANENKVKKFVFISSEAAYAYPMSDVVTENHPIGGIDNYGSSKAKAENIVQTELDDNIAYTILRPAQIYGKGDLSPFTERVLFLLRKPRIILPLNRDSGISLIHIDDVIRAIYETSIDSLSGNRIYNVSCSQKVSLLEIAQELSPYFSRIPRPLKLPVLLIRFMLTIRWVLKALQYSEVRPFIKTYGKGELTGSLLLGGPYFSNEKIKEEMAFQPTVSIKEGFKELI